MSHKDDKSINTKGKVQICITDADRAIYNNLVNKEHFLAVALKMFYSNPTLRAAFFKNQNVGELLQHLDNNQSDEAISPVYSTTATTTPVHTPVEQPEKPKRAW